MSKSRDASLAPIDAKKEQRLGAGRKGGLDLERGNGSMTDHFRLQYFFLRSEFCGNSAARRSSRERLRRPALKLQRRVPEQAAPLSFFAFNSADRARRLRRHRERRGCGQNNRIDRLSTRILVVE